jgi:hypothetical protein
MSGKGSTVSLDHVLNTVRSNPVLRRASSKKSEPFFVG